MVTVAFFVKISIGLLWTAYNILPLFYKCGLCVISRFRGSHERFSKDLAWDSPYGRPYGWIGESLPLHRFFSNLVRRFDDFTNQGVVTWNCCMSCCFKRRYSRNEPNRGLPSRYIVPAESISYMETVSFQGTSSVEIARVSFGTREG